MDITLSIPFAFDPDSPQEANAFVLRELLESMVRLNLVYLATHAPSGLYRSGVRYGRTTIWDTIPALYERGYGDCKSLTCALIAEYRMVGRLANPVFRFFRRPTDSGLDFHILVQTEKGFEDPSKDLGMGQDELKWFSKGY